jgi:hypothetical protein
MSAPSWQAEPPPKGEVSGIRSLIGGNDSFSLEKFPSLDTLVLGSITLIGKFQLSETLLITDPSFVQFAAAINSEKSLGVLLEKSKGTLRFQPQNGREIVTQLDFTEVLRPKGSNTKLDALTLAALVHADGLKKIANSKPQDKRQTSLIFLLDYIKSNSENRTAGFSFDFTSYGGHTPLWQACHNGQWEAVKVLVEAGASFFAKQDTGYCPVIEGLIGVNGLHFAQHILTDIKINGLDVFTYIARDVGWTDKTLLPTEPSGDGKIPEGRLNQKLKAARPDVGDTLIELLIQRGESRDGGVIVTPATGTDPVGSVAVPKPEGGETAKCGYEDCGSGEGLEKCRGCGHVFCGDHLDDHGCQGGA